MLSSMGMTPTPAPPVTVEIGTACAPGQCIYQQPAGPPTWVWIGCAILIGGFAGGVIGHTLVEQ